MAEVTYNNTPPPYSLNPNQPTQTEESNSDPYNKSSKTPLIIFLIVLIIITLLISIYLVFGRSVKNPVPPEIIQQRLPAGAN